MRTVNSGFGRLAAFVVASVIGSFEAVSAQTWDGGVALITLAGLFFRRNRA